MKIIGKTRDGFIAELSEYEMANLVGHAYPPARGYGHDVGDELDLRGMIGRTNDALALKTRLADYIRSIRACADLLEQPLAVAKRLADEPASE